MANAADDLKASVGELFLKSPGPAVVMATAQAGRKIQDWYDRAKHALQPTPKAVPADIELPPNMTRTPQGTTRATASKAEQRKRLKKLRIEEAEGGYVVNHHYQPEHGGTPAPKKHVFSSYADAHKHLEETMRSHK